VRFTDGYWMLQPGVTAASVDGGVPVAEDDAGLGIRIRATGMTMAITI